MSSSDRMTESHMLAVVQAAYGGGEVLKLGRMAIPRIGRDEVLVRVQAAGVDRAVWHLLTGTPYLVRLAYGLCRPRKQIPGFDLSGQVVAVGGQVTDLRVGDQVYGIGTGAYAEFARARADQLLLRPQDLDATAAAVCAMSGVTALQALCRKGGVRAGQDVLILGASGGVGAYAVQIAKHHGARVSALCSAAKADFVRRLGADEVFDYGVFDREAHRRRYDLIIDIAGNRPLGSLRRMLKKRGVLVMVGGEQAGPWTGGLGRQLLACLLNPFVHQQLRALVSVVNQDDLQSLGDLLAAGHVRPPLDCVFPMAEAGRAIDHLSRGRVRGKAALLMEPVPGQAPSQA